VVDPKHQVHQINRADEIATICCHEVT